MKVAILGYGVEGEITAKYFAGQGAEFEIRDANPDKAVPDGWKSQLGDDWLDNLDQFDLIMRTPSLRPDVIAAANPGVDLSNKLSSGLRYLLAHCPAPVIGITGTKGKGTTTTLISKILEAAGRKVHVGGNIGASFLGILEEVKADDLVVLELSSFQLIDADRSPHIAVCLMVVPEHLDWHKNEAEYENAKGNIFAHQNAEDLAVYFPGNAVSARLVKLSAGRHLPYTEVPGAFVRGDEIVIDEQVICKTDELKLIGPHNQQNVCAAITAVWELTDRNVEAIHEAVTSFSGLPLRIEWMGTRDGVGYVNDSFSTNPGSSIAAIKSFDGQKILILGGKDRGLEFDELAKVIAESNVREVVTLGETAAKIEKALDEADYKTYKRGGATLDEIIGLAASLAKHDDVVIFSPGCASFDMFKNFTVRGEAFRVAAKKLGVKP